MIRADHSDLSAASTQAPEPRLPSKVFDPLHAIRIVRAAGNALFSQVALHGQLLRVEWAEEKNRLLKMLLVTLLGFACLLCVMFFSGMLLLAISWDTGYRIPAFAALIALYGFGTMTAWRRFKTLSELSDRAFSATREELSADAALIRGKL